MSKPVEEILQSILDEFVASKQAREELEAKALFRLLNFCPPHEFETGATSSEFGQRVYRNLVVHLLGPISMKGPSSIPELPLRRQAADALRRARKTPKGPHRNDLRQLARGLLVLHKVGIQGIVNNRGEAISEYQDLGGR